MERPTVYRVVTNIPIPLGYIPLRELSEPELEETGGTGHLGVKLAIGKEEEKGLRAAATEPAAKRCAHEAAQSVEVTLSKRVDLLPIQEFTEENGTGYVRFGSPGERKITDSLGDWL